jgi:hypothetical protein
MEEKSIQSRGGKARAESLTPEQRSDIARTAAAARWQIPKATHQGKLEIAGHELNCAVLEDGRRILSERSIAKALGIRGSGAHWKRKKQGGADLPEYLSVTYIRERLSQELVLKLSDPITYLSVSKIESSGVEAGILQEICDFWIDLKEKGALQLQHIAIAERALLLLRGFAKIGIIALVDEATGYQEIRDRQALQAILDRFLRKELAAWAKTFPDEFYEQMFRLRGWQWKGMRVNRPQVVGKYTNDLVYERLAPKILDELKKRNPKNEKGERPAYYHQWLTEDVGHPALAQHLYALIGFMRVSNTWAEFYRMVQLAYPKKGSQLLLPGGIG